MQEIFKKLFKKFNVSDDKVDQFAADFSTIAILKLIEVTEDHFSDQEKLTMKKSLENKDFKSIEEIILSKYSPEEFNTIIESSIFPLFKDYHERMSQ